MNGRYDPAIVDMLKSGQVDLAGLLPDRNRYHLALLKHAYLAACMKFGVLQGDAADEIRRDLIAARTPQAARPCQRVDSPSALPCCAATNHLPR
jgi:hypothetical protein